MTYDELRDLVSRTLKSDDPVHQLQTAARLVESGRTEQGRVIAEQAVKVLNRRDVEHAIGLRRRA